MAKLKIVPSEHWGVLKEYLCNPGMVLVPEDAMSSFSDEQKSRLQEINEGGFVDYDFGGEPDLYIDIIYDRTSYAAEAILEIAN